MAIALQDGPSRTAGFWNHALESGGCSCHRFLHDQRFRPEGIVILGIGNRAFQSLLHQTRAFARYCSQYCHRVQQQPRVNYFSAKFECSDSTCVSNASRSMCGGGTNKKSFGFGASTATASQNAATLTIRKSSLPVTKNSPSSGLH